MHAIHCSMRNAFPCATTRHSACVRRVMSSPDLAVKVARLASTKYWMCAACGALNLRTGGMLLADVLLTTCPESVFRLFNAVMIRFERVVKCEECGSAEDSGLILGRASSLEKLQANTDDSGDSELHAGQDVVVRAARLRLDAKGLATQVRYTSLRFSLSGSPHHAVCGANRFTIGLSTTWCRSLNKCHRLSDNMPLCRSCRDHCTNKQSCLLISERLKR